MWSRSGIARLCRRCSHGTLDGGGVLSCGAWRQQRAASASSSSSSSSTTSSSPTASTSTSRDGVAVSDSRRGDGAAPAVSWMAGAAWASLGSEFKDVDEDKYLRPCPDTFLSPRATTSVQAAEELLRRAVAENEERYRGIDVRDPASLAVYEATRPRWMTRGGQVRAVAEFISGHLCHHIALPEWRTLFDLQYAEMDLTFWLYVLHLHLISRRATSIPIATFSRRREVLEELLVTMFDSWVSTSEDIMGRPPLSKIKHYIQDMYYVTAANLEEALLHDGAGADLMLMGFLMKFCPLPRPEDVPVYTYYTLVHYIRFHTALFDRIPDEAFAKGNFNFVNPTDARIFAPYTSIPYDDVTHAWPAAATADAQTSTATAPPRIAAAAADTARDDATRIAASSSDSSTNKNATTSA